MSDHGYIKGTGHAANLSQAMDDFYAALTYRWRAEVTKKIMNLDEGGFPRDLRPAWEYRNGSVADHLRTGLCSFVKWIEDGQHGPLNAVNCQGLTGNEYGPANIQCGMGGVLKTVEDWAWAERVDIYPKLPLFDAHDLGKLEAAHNAFLEIGGRLGLQPASGSKVPGEAFPVMSGRVIVGKVNTLAGATGQGQDWWAGWTGLAASRAKAGFFDSCVPSLNNQSGIVGSLANLYSARAAIVEKARNDALYWIQWAAKSLKETQPITTNLVPGWKTIQGIGAAVTIPGAFVPVAGAVGAAVQLLGFLGENLMPGINTEGYKYDLAVVLDQLTDKIGELVSTIGYLESEYGMKVAELEDTIYRIHSYNLELYDLTRNDPHGDDSGPKDGYEADIEAILAIGRACYEAGNRYAELLPVIDRTSEADQHLADRDGRPTEGDTSLLGTRALLAEFLKTTCGRYVVAGDQVKAAAEAYVQAEPGKKAAFDRIMEDWQQEGVGRYDPTLDDYADATGRPGHGDSPYPGSSNRSPSAVPPAPGADDGKDYKTQK